MTEDRDRADIVAILTFVADRRTVSEILFGDDLPARSFEQVITDTGREREALDAIVLKARSLLIRLGEAS